MPAVTESKGVFSMVISKPALSATSLINSMSKPVISLVCSSTYSNGGKVASVATVTLVLGALQAVSSMARMARIEMVNKTVRFTLSSR
jgi:hypothetical protein